MPKISFPNRACPKCGKPIHVRLKSHESCGWTSNGKAKQRSTHEAQAKEASSCEGSSGQADGRFDHDGRYPGGEGHWERRRSLS